MTVPRAPQTAPPDPPIRVLVVDQSAADQASLGAGLAGDPAFAIAGWAATGADTAKVVTRLHPDLVILGVHGDDGRAVDATRHIMHLAPTPIVAFTVGEEHAATRQALLRAGALAVLPGPFAITAPGAEAVRTLKTMARVKVIRRPSPDSVATGDGRRPKGEPRAPDRANGARPPRRLELVVIGASTGGPQALEEVLTRLPSTYPLPVLVVQHIASGFVESLTTWLGGRCALPVTMATHGQPLNRPGISFAPSDRHLVIRGRAAALTDEARVGGHRPSATVLFRSAAREYGAAAVGVLLSGMGDDGAAGLRDLKAAGGLTIAQDETSSAVFGMPAAAIGLGVVDHVLPPPSIGALLASFAPTPGTPVATAPATDSGGVAYR